MFLPPPRSTLFPYTTLFRSERVVDGVGEGVGECRGSGCTPAGSNSIGFSAGCGCGCAFRSEEHTSELQSRRDLVCRLLLEKKKETLTTHVQLHTSDDGTLIV